MCSMSFNVDHSKTFLKEENHREKQQRKPRTHNKV